MKKSDTVMIGINFGFKNFLTSREFPDDPVVRTLHFYC